MIDEYLYLTKTDKATGSIFQKVVDEILADSQIFELTYQSKRTKKHFYEIKARLISN